MKNDDVELIQQVLAGDENAFAELVKKYQKPVHALAWRKVGDFHIAEEITQDTFLKAYQNLATLKKPHRFVGWLYVIATHCCHAWLRKKRIQTESLEELDSDELEPEAYSRYVAEQEAKAIAETQRQVVKKLLATLPESERTVITLHYFGEMTCEKMSEFLGVSANTIKSRLRRARNRLKKEEPMIREAISNFQISPNLTDNIMKEIARLNPAAPAGSKPLIPWVIGASSAVLIVLMLGIGSQYLARFQRPYSLDAQSEMTVDIIDAPIVQDVDAKPDVRNQPGERSDTGGRDDGTGKESNQVVGDQGDYTLWGLPEGAKRRLGKGMFTDMQLSPNGTRLAIASSTGIWLYNVNTGKETALLTINTDLTGLVAFSPDGTRIASTSGDNTCRIWDVESQRLLSTFKVPNYWIRSLRFLDDGKTLVGEGLIDKISHTLTGKVLIWDVPKVWMWNSTTGKLLDTFTTKLPKFNALKDARTGVPVKGFANGARALFAFENKDYTISVKDGSTDQEIAIFPRTEQKIREFVFSPDGKRLAIAYSKGVQLWDVDTSKQIATFPVRIPNFSGNPEVLAFSKDGKILAVADFNDISVWNTETHSHITTIKNRDEEGIWEFVLSSDGSTIVTMNQYGTVNLWSAATGKHLRTFTTEYTYKFSALAFAHDGKTIASNTRSKIHLWDTNTGTEKLQLQNPVHPAVRNTLSTMNRDTPLGRFDLRNDIVSIAFSSGDSTLSASTASGEIKAWDAVTGKYNTTYNFVTASRNRSVKSAPDIFKVASPRTTEMYHFYATAFEKGSHLVQVSTFSPSGEKLAVTNKDTAIEVWDLPTGNQLCTLKGSNPNLSVAFDYTLAFTPDGETLAIGEGQDIHLSNIHSGETFAKFKMPKKKPNLIDKIKSFFGRKPIDQKVEAVALAQNGRIHLAASQAKTIYLWNVTTQERILRIKGHTDAVCKLAFTTDGTILASGDVGGIIHLWDIPTGRKLTTYKPYASPITQLVFSPDGKTLASTNLHSHFAGTILLWDVPSK